MISNDSQPGKIFVGGLANETTKSSLKQYFEKYGDILECMLMQDKVTGRSRGFGFVTFKDSSNAQKVCGMASHIIDYKIVDCKLAVPSSQLNPNGSSNLIHQNLHQHQHQQVSHHSLHQPLKSSSVHTASSASGNSTCTNSTHESNKVNFSSPNNWTKESLNGNSNSNDLGQNDPNIDFRNPNDPRDESNKRNFGQFERPSNPPSNSTSSYNSRKLFIGGLPSNATESDLIDYFKLYGEILDCMVMYDKNTGKPRGFGFVVFKDEQTIDNILRNKNKHLINGKWIDCKRATPKDVIDSQNTIKGGFVPRTNPDLNNAYYNPNNPGFNQGISYNPYDQMPDYFRYQMNNNTASFLQGNNEFPSNSNLGFMGNSGVPPNNMNINQINSFGQFPPYNNVSQFHQFNQYNQYNQINSGNKDQLEVQWLKMNAKIDTTNNSNSLNAPNQFLLPKKPSNTINNPKKEQDISLVQHPLNPMNEKVTALFDKKNLQKGSESSDGSGPSAPMLDSGGDSNGSNTPPESKNQNDGMKFKNKGNFFNNNIQLYLVNNSEKSSMNEILIIPKNKQLSQNSLNSFEKVFDSKSNSDSNDMDLQLQNFQDKNNQVNSSLDYKSTLNNLSYFNGFNNCFTRKTIFNAIEEKNNFLESLKKSEGNGRKGSNNQALFNYFNYKFSNMEGENIKLNFEADPIYPKFTKKETLFKNNKDDIHRYKLQSELAPVMVKKQETTSSNGSLTGSGSSDDDEIKSLLDLGKMKDRETRKFKPY